jgi:hypothetical protein
MKSLATTLLVFVLAALYLFGCSGPSPTSDTIRVAACDVRISDERQNIPIPSEMKSYLRYFDEGSLGVNFNFIDEYTSASANDHGLHVAYTLHQNYPGPIALLPVALSGDIQPSDGEKASQDFVATMAFALRREISIFNFSMGILPAVWASLNARDLYVENKKYSNRGFKYDRNLTAPALRSNIANELSEHNKNGAVMVFSLGNAGDHLGGTLATNIKVALVKQFPDMFILVGEYQHVEYYHRKVPLGDVVSSDTNSDIGSRIVYANTPVDYFGHPASGSSIAAPQVTGAIARICADHPNISPRAAAILVLDSADPIAPWTDDRGETHYLGRGLLNLDKALEAAKKMESTQ